jgi:hypothetical protein
VRKKKFGCDVSYCVKSVELLTTMSSLFCSCTDVLNVVIAGRTAIVQYPLNLITTNVVFV